MALILQQTWCKQVLKIQILKRYLSFERSATLPCGTLTPLINFHDNTSMRYGILSQIYI